MMRSHCPASGGPDLEPAGRIDHVQSSEDVGIAQIAIDSHALAIARNIVANLGEPPQLRWTPQEPGAPCYAPEEIYGIVSANKRIPTDNREIVARLIDGSRFQGFKHLYGETMMCGFARINGFEIGILANNGVLFSESAIKGAHFIELCCKRDIRYCFWSTSRALWSAPPSNGRELPSMARCS
jgi:acetyl-CoA carboxylase carboxyltransferase component